MNPFRVDKDVQSNVQPKIEYFDTYVRKPINVRKTTRQYDYDGEEEIIYCYDEELYYLADWKNQEFTEELLSAQQTIADLEIELLLIK